MKDHQEIKNLASVVQYWLSYWDTVSRASMLQESSLRYAISEIIERRFNGVCLLELPHPRFTSKNIDVIWADYNENDSILSDFCKKGINRKNNQKLKKKLHKLYSNCDIIECKIASKYSNTKHEKQRIFNDICRLYFFKKLYPNRHVYFLLSGAKRFFEAVSENGFLGDEEIIERQVNEFVEKQKNKRDSDLLAYLEGHVNLEGITFDDSHAVQSETLNTELTQDSPQQDEVISSMPEEKDTKEESMYIQWLSFNLKAKEIPLDFIYKPDNNYAKFYDLYNENKKSTAKKKVKKSVSILTEEEKHIKLLTKLIALNIASNEEETAHSVAIWEIIPTD